MAWRWKGVFSDRRHRRSYDYKAIESLLLTSFSSKKSCRTQLKRGLTPKRRVRGNVLVIGLYAQFFKFFRRHHTDGFWNLKRNAIEEINYVISLNSCLTALVTPSFAEAVPNVTVVAGKDAVLPCIVDNLEHFKVRKKKQSTFFSQSPPISNCVISLPNRLLGCGSTRKPSSPFIPKYNEKDINLVPL